MEGITEGNSFFLASRSVYINKEASVNNFENNKIGLVFSGGGAKGSYQIGVWKALREVGLERVITHVSGTSVGALNACFFAIGAFEQAVEAWNSLAVRDVLAIDKNKIDALATKVEDLGIARTFAESALSLLGKNRSGGIFSRNRLSRLIEQELDSTAIQHSQIKAYATCFEKSTMEAEYFLLNTQNAETIKAILLASSAIPVVFESHTIGQKEYLDGGLVDNTPIRPLYDAGVRSFIVVHLSQTGVVDTKLYPGARFLEIASVRDRGNFLTGTLNFSRQTVEQGLDDGYTDAMDILQKDRRVWQEMFGLSD